MRKTEQGRGRQIRTSLDRPPSLPPLRMETVLAERAALKKDLQSHLARKTHPLLPDASGRPAAAGNLSGVQAGTPQAAQAGGPAPSTANASTQVDSGRLNRQEEESLLRRRNEEAWHEMMSMDEVKREGSGMMTVSLAGLRGAPSTDLAAAAAAWDRSGSVRRMDEDDKDDDSLQKGSLSSPLPPTQHALASPHILPMTSPRRPPMAPSDPMRSAAAAVAVVSQGPRSSNPFFMGHDDEAPVADVTTGRGVTRLVHLAEPRSVRDAGLDVQDSEMLHLVHMLLDNTPDIKCESDAGGGGSTGVGGAMLATPPDILSPGTCRSGGPSTLFAMPGLPMPFPPSPFMRQRTPSDGPGLSRGLSGRPSDPSSCTTHFSSEAFAALRQAGVGTVIGSSIVSGMRRADNSGRLSDSGVGVWDNARGDVNRISDTGSGGKVVSSGFRGTAGWGPAGTGPGGTVAGGAMRSKPPSPFSMAAADASVPWQQGAASTMAPAAAATATAADAVPPEAVSEAPRRSLSVDGPEEDSVLQSEGVIAKLLR